MGKPADRLEVEVETVSIKIPASPVYLRVVRLMASGLASRLGFTLDDIEDLKIGVDELAAYITRPQGPAGMLEIFFDVEDTRISVRGVGHFEGTSTIRTELTEFSRQILDTVAESASLEQKNGMPAFSLTKSKT